MRAVVSLQHDALLVPQRAVSELQGAYQVAVVDGDNKVSIRTVTVGDRVGSEWVMAGVGFVEVKGWSRKEFKRCAQERSQREPAGTEHNRAQPSRRQAVVTGPVNLVNLERAVKAARRAAAAGRGVGRGGGR